MGQPKPPGIGSWPIEQWPRKDTPEVPLHATRAGTLGTIQNPHTPRPDAQTPQSPSDRSIGPPIHEAIDSGPTSPRPAPWPKAHCRPNSSQAARTSYDGPRDLDDKRPGPDAPHTTTRPSRESANESSANDPQATFRLACTFPAAYKTPESKEQRRSRPGSDSLGSHGAIAS